MAVLYSATGVRIRAVRNLGWLLRNWRTAQSVKVEPIRFQSGAGMSECRLIVSMNPATTPGGVAEYRTDFACARLLWDWLRRPVLSGLPLQWGTEPASTIGDKPGKYPGHP